MAPSAMDRAPKPKMSSGEADADDAHSASATVASTLAVRRTGAAEPAGEEPCTGASIAAVLPG
ncbi:MAG: hypothetical protein WKG00_25765 [Polyangiaceae bacterium]